MLQSLALPCQLILHLKFSGSNRGIDGLDARRLGVYLCLEHVSEGSAGAGRLAVLAVGDKVEQDGSRSMVVGVEECQRLFLRNKNMVSRSSRYLVKYVN